MKSKAVENRTTAMADKLKFEDYTETEFLEFLMVFFNPEDASTEDDESDERIERYESRMDLMVDHFESVTEHPGGSDLIFYPEKGKGSPKAIIELVKNWRAANGKPGFKPG